MLLHFDFWQDSVVDVKPSPPIQYNQNLMDNRYAGDTSKKKIPMLDNTNSFGFQFEALKTIHKGYVKSNIPNENLFRFECPICTQKIIIKPIPLVDRKTLSNKILYENVMTGKYGTFFREKDGKIHDGFCDGGDQVDLTKYKKIEYAEFLTIEESYAKAIEMKNDIDERPYYLPYIHKNYQKKYLRYWPSGKETEEEKLHKDLKGKTMYELKILLLYTHDANSLGRKNELIDRIIDIKFHNKDCVIDDLKWIQQISDLKRQGRRCTTAKQIQAILSGMYENATSTTSTSSSTTTSKNTSSNNNNNNNEDDDNSDRSSVYLIKRQADTGKFGCDLKQLMYNNTVVGVELLSIKHRPELSTPVLIKMINGFPINPMTVEGAIALVLKVDGIENPCHFDILKRIQGKEKTKLPCDQHGEFKVNPLTLYYNIKDVVSNSINQTQCIDAIVNLRKLKIKNLLMTKPQFTAEEVHHIVGHNIMPFTLSQKRIEVILNKFVTDNAITKIGEATYQITQQVV